MGAVDAEIKDYEKWAAARVRELESSAAELENSDDQYMLMDTDDPRSSSSSGTAALLLQKYEIDEEMEARANALEVFERNV